MNQLYPLIALALFLLSALAPIAIGAYLLKNVVTDATELATRLPTRIPEDTSEAREANRSRALWETIWLLAVRSAPGAVAVVVGLGLLVCIFRNALDLSVRH